MKTKPTQHSVKELREIGIQPDVVLCRADRPVPEGDRRKIALFTNVAAGSRHPGARRGFDLQDPGHAARGRARRHRLQEAADQSAAGRPRPSGIAWSTRSSIREHEVNIAMVGKYVDLTESYKSLSEALIHAGIHTRSKVNIHYVDSEVIETEGVDSLRGMDAILVPGGFGKRGVEGKIKAVRLAREDRHSVSRHLPRHAARGHRVRAPHGGPRQRQQHRVRCRHAASGRRADHRMAEPRRLDREAHARAPTWAARCASARSRARWCRDRSRTASTARPRSPSGIAIATRSTTTTCRASRPRASRSARGRRAPRRAIWSRWSSCPEHPWFFGCQFHPEFTSNPRRGHPLFISFVQAALDHRQRAARRRPSHGGGRAASRRSDRQSRAAPDETLRLRRRPRPPLFLIAGPCVVESRQLQMDVAGELKAICASLDIPFIFKSSYDKANRSSHASFRGPGMEEGLRVLADVRKHVDVPVLTDVHAIDEIAAVAAVVDVLQTPAFLCRQTDFIQAVASAGKPVNIKKGQFLAPEDMQQVVAKAQGGERHRQHHGVRARRVVRLSQPRVRHALARDHARHRTVRSCSMRRTRCSCRAGRARRRAASASSCRCWRARPSRPASPGSSWRRTRSPRRRCPTAPTRGRCRACARCSRRWSSSMPRVEANEASPTDAAV